jgi:hypothetical protein
LITSLDDQVYAAENPRQLEIEAEFAESAIARALVAGPVESQFRTLHSSVLELGASHSTLSHAIQFRDGPKMPTAGGYARVRGGARTTAKATVATARSALSTNTRFFMVVLSSLGFDRTDHIVVTKLRTDDPARVGDRKGARPISVSLKHGAHPQGFTDTPLGGSSPA